MEQKPSGKPHHSGGRTRFLDRKVVYDHQVIFRQGGPGDAVYLIEKGNVQLVREEPGGAEHQLAVLGPGSIFGEMAVIDGGARMATARCQGGAIIVGLEQKKVTRRLQAVDAHSRRLFELLLRYIRMTPLREERADAGLPAEDSELDRIARKTLQSDAVRHRHELSDRFVVAMFDVLISYVHRRLPETTSTSPDGS